MLANVEDDEIVKEVQKRVAANKAKIKIQPKMTCLCVFWVLLSTLATTMACTGFYLPYWIQGTLGKSDAYFSSFGRCNYPKIITPNRPPQVVHECASFWDIPSPWWQASTVAIVIGLAIAIISALVQLAAASTFLPYIFRSPKQTRLLGFFQLVAASMICGGLMLYPLGWDNREVRESCGKGANVYNLGRCSISYSSYVLSAAVVLLTLCFFMSFCVVRFKAHPEPSDALRI